jgi:ATP-binding cassette subfamily F protein 3
MDEPTTHLDIASIDALVDALKQFAGTLVFISPDVHFITALGNKIIHVADGKLTHYMGDYEFYLHKTASTSARAALTAGGTKQSKKAVKEAKKKAKAEAQNDNGQSSRGQGNKGQSPRAVMQKQQKVVKKIEDQIETAESRQAELTAELELPQTWGDQKRAADLNKELDASKQRSTELTAKWELEAARLEEVTV